MRLEYSVNSNNTYFRCSDVDKTYITFESAFKGAVTVYLEFKIILCDSNCITLDILHNDCFTSNGRRYQFSNILVLIGVTNHFYINGGGLDL